MTDPDRVPVPSKRIAARLIAGKALLLDPQTDVLRRLNEVGSFLWALIEAETHSVAALRDAVVAEFEIEADVAAADVDEFLAKLVSEGFLEFRPT